MKYYRNYLFRSILEHKKILVCCLAFYVIAFGGYLRLGHSDLVIQRVPNILLYEDEGFFFLFFYPISLVLLYSSINQSKSMEWVRLSNKEKYYIANVIQVNFLVGILSFFYLLIYRGSILFYPSDSINLTAYLESFLGIYIQLTAYLMVFHAMLQLEISRIYILIAFLIGCFMNSYFLLLHPEFRFTLIIYKTQTGNGVFSGKSLLFLGMIIGSYLLGEWLFHRKELL